MTHDPHNGKPSCRALPGMASALVVGVAALSLVEARAHEHRPTAADLRTSAPEDLEVDASRFTAIDFDWVDSQRQRRVPAKLYLPVTQAIAGSVPLASNYLAVQAWSISHGELVAKFESRCVPTCATDTPQQ